MNNNLISEETKEALELLIQKMFYLNRLWDRGLSVMDTKFAYSNFESIFHSGLAHKYPLLADDISNILSMYNMDTVYLETPTDKADYDTPLSFFERNLNAHIDAYNLIKNAKRICVEKNDINVESEINKFMVDFNRYMNQAYLLVDKAIVYGNNYASFDAHADKFYKMEVGA